ncbi:MAG: paraquat-inducible protein A [Desulfobacter sp.]|nr:MAG: paraquat-inducible protein A [Desulfobacter sp.]
MATLSKSLGNTGADRPVAVAACPDCGMAQAIPDLPFGAAARCCRCDARLAGHRGDTVQRTLALALAGLVLFCIANAFPFLSLRLEGQIRETCLLTGIVELYRQGFAGLAVLVLATCVAVPLAQLAGLAYLMVPAAAGRAARHTAPVFRLLVRLKPWGMIEVYMLAILVAMIKLAKMADIVAGPGLWAFVGLIVVVAAAFSGLNPEDVWQRLPRQKVPEPWGGALTACHCCALTTPLAPSGESGRCPRCGARLRAVKPLSLQRTWALVLAAVVFYVPANILPVTITRTLGAEQADTIMSGVIYFMLSGSWHIALIIFTASILIPMLKLLILIYLLLSVQFRSRWKPGDRTRLYRFTEAVGRWSMVDVYVVTVLAALVRLSPLASVAAGPGAVYFAAVVVITMVAAESFDSRLIWQYGDPGENPRI